MLEIACVLSYFQHSLVSQGIINGWSTWSVTKCSPDQGVRSKPQSSARRAQSWYWYLWKPAGRISWNGRVRKVQTLTRQPTEGLQRLSFDGVCLVLLLLPARCCLSVGLLTRVDLSSMIMRSPRPLLVIWRVRLGSLFAQLGRSCKGRRFEIWRNGPWAANALRIQWLQGRWFLNKNIWSKWIYQIYGGLKMIQVGNCGGVGSCRNRLT